VTGAAGFIGSHATESLLGDGHQVVGLDNFDPFYPRAVKEQNLAAARRHPGFRLVEADIRDPAAVAAAFQDGGPFDAVLHLAAKAGVRPSIAEPLLYAQVNIVVTLNLLDQAARQRPRPRFVFGSSSSVYGNNPKVPFSETDPVDNPISPYAATKKAGELLAYTYHHLEGMAVWCLRFFTVYGPRQRPDLAIHKFARLILAGRPVQQFGDGTSSRDYTYIDDIVCGVRRALERCEGYEIVNLGSKNPVSLGRMIEVVAEACGRRPTVEVLPDQAGDVERTFADVAKAERLLDYRPTMPFEEGVRRFVAWLRGEAGAEAISVVPGR
jgi:UDP-glucuronate 4-epimerase